MPIDFPNSPAPNDTFTVGDRTWRWTGSVWESVANPGVAGSANQIVYKNSSNAPAGSNALTFDGTNFATTGTATAASFIPTSSTIPANGMYLGAANQLNFATNSVNRFTISDNGTATATGALIGSAFLPTGSFVITNGIYRPAANQLGFSTNSVNRLTISDTGVSTFTGNVVAPAIVPSSSTPPTNGMFLGAANTLSFAASSANRVNISSAGLTVLRIDATNEGGQLSLARSSDNATGWFLDVFGTGTDTNLRFVQNTSGGELERASFNTTGQLVANPAVPTAANSAKAVGYVGMPQNAPTISGAYTYTFGLADAGEHFYATGTPSSVTLTIPASGVTNFEIGTTIVIINDLGAATNISIAINTDTLVLAGTGTTGTRTLGRYGMATLVKVTGTKWYISGNGLT